MNPLLRAWALAKRLVLGELRAYADLARLIRRRRDIPPGHTGFGYTKGSAAVPMIFLVLSIVELVAVHFLIPWTWLKLVLLFLTLWGLLFLGGFLASRAVRPHLVGPDGLTLRWGRRTVLHADLADLESAERHTDHGATQAAVSGGTLTLSQFQSTNVRLRFARPVLADPPVSRKDRPERYRATEVLLAVDDPAAFIAGLRG